MYWKAIVRDGKVSAACLLGDLGPADDLMRLFLPRHPAPDRRLELFFTAAVRPRSEVSLADLPDAQQICDCNGVSKGTICAAIRAGKCTVPAVGKATRAGTGCGSCKRLVKGLIEAVAGGVKADPSEAWYVPAVPMDKPTLVAEVRTAAAQERLGRPPRAGHRRGREEQERAWRPCSSPSGATEYVDERDARFINDRVHANIQKDGTFSVVPRIYGGVTSADELIRIGEVAKKYNVPMVKITGGQRIDLLGIRKEELPEVWRDLGMPSGYAYTKAFRTCKTCVGTRVLPVRHQRLDRPRHRHREAVPGVRVPGQGEDGGLRVPAELRRGDGEGHRRGRHRRRRVGDRRSAAPPGRASASPTSSAG